jgi:hypothetical protein
MVTAEFKLERSRNLVFKNLCLLMTAGTVAAMGLDFRNDGSQIILAEYK